MKARIPYPKTVLSGAGLLCLTLVLVAWSPPTEDITMPGGSPALNIGTNNDMDGWSHVGPPVSATTVLRGIVVGSQNHVGSSVGTTGYAAIVGNQNTANVVSTVVGGSLNRLADNATAFNSCVRYSGVFGYSHVVAQGADSVLLGGKSHSITGTGILATGSANTVEGATAGSGSFYSAAIGELNHVEASRGWAMGYSNTISGNRGIAMGSGLNATNEDSSALGRYNEPMESDDVVAIGTGTDANNPSTALRVTADGGVILGRAQGDISMGDYGN